MTYEYQKKIKVLFIGVFHFPKTNFPNYILQAVWVKNYWLDANLGRQNTGYFLNP